MGFVNRLATCSVCAMWGLEPFGLIYFPQIESQSINENGEWISYNVFEALGDTFLCTLVESKIKS